MNTKMNNNPTNESTSRQPAQTWVVRRPCAPLSFTAFSNVEQRASGPPVCALCPGKCFSGQENRHSKSWAFVVEGSPAYVSDASCAPEVQKTCTRGRAKGAGSTSSGSLDARGAQKGAQGVGPSAAARPLWSEASRLARAPGRMPGKSSSAAAIHTAAPTATSKG